jgi:L-arabinokinase
MALVVFYVTGHGLGHATRSCEVISGLVSRGLRVTVVTTADERFFRSALGVLAERCIFVHKELDAGAVQSDALRVDPEATLLAYMQRIHVQRAALLSGEVHFLAEQKPALVIADATPIAIRAASISGVRSVILSNFTWDVCYSAMIETIRLSNFASSAALTAYQLMCDEIADDYAACDYYLQYPGAAPPPHGMSSTKLVSLPMVARFARRTRAEQRLELGLPESIRVLLLGFGGQATSWKDRLISVVLPGGWVCVVLGAKPSELPDDVDVHGVRRFIAAPYDAYVPDLVNATDVMIGKIGYGTVSECLAHNVPLLYVPRLNWAEEVFLEHFLLSHGGGFRMENADFDAGDWGLHLNSVLLHRDPEQKPTHGPSVFRRPDREGTLEVLEHLLRLVNFEFSGLDR